jgi:hypothetical protein
MAGLFDLGALRNGAVDLVVDIGSESTIDGL